jgi:hypothetical protein
MHGPLDVKICQNYDNHNIHNDAILYVPFCTFYNFNFFTYRNPRLCTSQIDVGACTALYLRLPEDHTLAP